MGLPGVVWPKETRARPRDTYRAGRFRTDPTSFLPTPTAFPISLHGRRIAAVRRPRLLPPSRSYPGHESLASHSLALSVALSVAIRDVSPNVARYVATLAAHERIYSGRPLADDARSALETLAGGTNAECKSNVETVDITLPGSLRVSAGLA